MGSKYVVIEYEVLDNPNLTNTEKILYGYIVALSQNEKGCCFMKTSRLCEIMNLKERQLRYCLAKLKKFNYISLTVIKNKRYITPTINKFMSNREKENDKIQLIDYNWLDED